MENKQFSYYLRKHNFVSFSFVALFITIWLTTLPKSTISTIQIIWLLSLIFVGWSIIHHFLDKSLKMEVVIEYLVTVGLVMVILLSFLQ